MGKGRNSTGTFILAIVWPAILVMLVYYGFKKLSGNPGVSNRHGETESIMCLLGGCLLVPVILYLQGDPFVMTMFRQF